MSWGYCSGLLVCSRLAYAMFEANATIVKLGSIDRCYLFVT